MSKNKLQQLEKIFSDSHICEIKARFNELECSAEKCDTCPLGIGDGICLKNTFELKWKLQKENHELRKNKTIMSMEIVRLEKKIQELNSNAESNPANFNTELNPIILEEIAHCRCGKGLEYEMSNGHVTFKRHNYCSNCGRKFEWDKAISEFNQKYNK